MSLSKGVDGTRQHNDGIGGAEIAPRVSARTANDHFEAAAAEGFRNDGVRAGSVEHQDMGDGILPAGSGKNVAHAAQVTLPLFADVADKNQRQSMANADGTQYRRNREHRRDPRAVVGDAGTVETCSLLADIERGAGWKNCIDVRAQGNVSASKAGMHAEYVPHIIGVDVVQPQFLKAFRQPCPSRGFPKGRRRYASHFQLPVRELRLLSAKPVVAGADFGRCGQTSDILLNFREGIRNFALRDRGHGLKRD